MGSIDADRSVAAYAPGSPHTPTPEQAEWLRTATWAEVIDMLGKSAAYLNHMADQQPVARTKEVLRGSAAIVRQVQNSASITAEKILIDSR